MQGLFDLNIEQVLENWSIADALREIIANALDEQVLTNTRPIEIFKDNDVWHIRDYGRGLQYIHFTHLVFVLVSVIGSLLSWFSSLLVYGYGESIDRAMSIDDKLSQVPSHDPTTDDEWQCACGKINPFSTETCISCGREKSDAKFSNEED